MDFNEVYNFKNNVQGTVADLINMNALDSLIKIIQILNFR